MNKLFFICVFVILLGQERRIQLIVKTCNSLTELSVKNAKDISASFPVVSYTNTYGTNILTNVIIISYSHD